MQTKPMTVADPGGGGGGGGGGGHVSSPYHLPYLSSRSIEQVNGLREIQALRRLTPHPNIIDLKEVIL